MNYLHSFENTISFNLKTEITKKKSFLHPAVLSLLFNGISWGPDDETCQESPEICTCFNDPLRCAYPGGTNEMKSYSFIAVSKLPVGKK